MTIIIFDGFSLELSVGTKLPFFPVFSIVLEVIEQLDRSVMAIRGATRNIVQHYMKYVSTREIMWLATYTKNSPVYPIKIQPDFEQETYL